jgi:hypothetical protein
MKKILRVSGKAEPQKSPTLLAIERIQAALGRKPYVLRTEGGKIISIEVNEEDEAATQALLDATERDYPEAF